MGVGGVSDGGDALWPMVAQLLVAGRAWSTGAPFDHEALTSTRDQLLLTQHRRHLARIPAYRDLASELGITAGAHLDQLTEDFLISAEWFKSYDVAWLAGDFDALTGWVGNISTTRPAPRASETDLASWRSGLRDQGVFVTVSSATGGQPSLVPRDVTTLAALRNSSGVRLPWALPPDAYDALLLTDRGMGSGLQAGAAGLAANARRTFHLDEPGAPEFVRQAVAAKQPVLVYGSPARLHFLLTAPSGARPPRLPPGSAVITGGGWKRDTAGDIVRLHDHAAAELGVDRDRCVDAYSSAELNTILVCCPHGRYHVPPVISALVVDDLLRPQPGDQDGRLAVLDPFAMAYPGRLVTGDRVRLRHDRCPCGQPGQSILAPITRMAGVPARGCGVVVENYASAAG